MFPSLSSPPFLAQIFYPAWAEMTAILGGDGDDLIIGGDGNDVCLGGSGTDRFDTCESEIQ